MKNLIFILIMLLPFVACQKQEVEPKQQLITVEVYVFTPEQKNIDIYCAISSKNVDYSEVKNLTFEGSSIIFKYRFMADMNEPINFEINLSEPVFININAYIDSRQIASKIVENGIYTIIPTNSGIIIN
jgi:hypothetical protein